MISLVDLYIEFFPTWLGPALISIGSLAIIRYISFDEDGLLLPNNENAKIISVPDKDSWFSFSFFVISYGIFLFAYPELTTYFMYFIVISMSIIKASTTVRIYDRIILFVREQSTGAGSSILVVILTIIFAYLIISIGVSILILYYIYTGSNVIFAQQLRLWYTLVTAVVAFIGLYSKYFDLKRRNWSMYLFLGITLVFTGSEIYNMRSLTDELLVIAISYFVYHIFFIFYCYVNIKNY